MMGATPLAPMAPIPGMYPTMPNAMAPNAMAYMEQQMAMHDYNAKVQPLLH